MLRFNVHLNLPIAHCTRMSSSGNTAVAMVTRLQQVEFRRATDQLWTYHLRL